MRIVVINPNTTAAMTETIGRAAAAAATPGTEVVAGTPRMGPVSIESHYDEALAVPEGTAPLSFDAAQHLVTAAAGDPPAGRRRSRPPSAGLSLRGPVVGIAEAAMRTAAFLGRSYSVVRLPRQPPTIPRER